MRTFFNLNTQYDNVQLIHHIYITTSSSEYCAKWKISCISRICIDCIIFFRVVRVRKEAAQQLFMANYCPFFLRFLVIFSAQHLSPSEALTRPLCVFSSDLLLFRNRCIFSRAAHRWPVAVHAWRINFVGLIICNYYSHYHT